MKLVIQRVKHASVSVEDQCIGKIGTGLLVFVGVGKNDTKEMVKKYVDKMIKMRIFADENGKTNLSLKDINGSLLVVSQFTLYADCKKGNRPNFLDAASPETANALYEYFISECRAYEIPVETGEFGADMDIDLCNDGPFTIVLDHLFE